MKIDKKLKELPLTKSNPKTLESLFGKTDIQPFWVADMEFQIAKPIQESLKERITNSGFGYEYKPDSFFIAQKKWYDKNYGIDLNKNHLIYSPSITTTISILIENFTSESNGIITQPPVFMEFRDVIRNTKRRIVKNPLKLTEKQYQIDFKDLEEKAKIENNKILIICNPHNPVGRVWTKEELNQIVTICKENDLLLVSDEIHKDIILFDNKFTSALQFIDDYDKIVVCTSEAKTFNLCGIADSMTIIPNEDMKKSISNTFKKYNLGRTNALTRVAMESAYNQGQSWLKEVINIVEENIKSIETELENSKIELIKPQGTYQVWLDFRKVYKDTKEMFSHLTENSGIGLNAGHWFGREGALFMRMNIATSNEKVIVAIKKIIKAVPNN
ncbi:MULTISPECIES: MalY/PatB family protein [unclassified Lentimicrobium]|uniref:MalY/PatB family protein n=1 Tax=unclassified Lentimicrobium TaxID=2677434 RepID=UPI001554A769|nr:MULTISPECIES: PatB family C-S lyase [unclassified Lentimicrobium]NPD48304.1 putative C-S lyase [Lentimicrobium sp. S6]NPD86924.1 putative C-S lyase [Lentimicrobium sp. L6]